MRIRSTARLARIAVAVGGVLLMSSLLSGGFTTALNAVVGMAPLRYRDVVFPDVTITPTSSTAARPT